MQSYWDQRVTKQDENTQPNIPAAPTKLSLSEKIISHPSKTRSEHLYNPMTPNIISKSLQAGLKIQNIFTFYEQPTLEDSESSIGSEIEAKQASHHPKTLFVGNITCTDDNLVQATLIEKLGQNKIESIEFCKPLSAQKKRHALVTLLSEEFVDDVISSDTKALFKETALHKCVVDRYRSFSQDPETSLFLYIDKEWSDKQISKLFTERLDVHVTFERSLSRKGRKLNFGFLYFEKSGDLEYVFHNQQVMEPFVLTRVKDKEYRRSSEDVEEGKVFLKLEEEGLAFEISDFGTFYE